MNEEKKINSTKTKKSATTKTKSKVTKNRKTTNTKSKPKEEVTKSQSENVEKEEQVKSGEKITTRLPWSRKKKALVFSLIGLISLITLITTSVCLYNQSLEKNTLLFNDSDYLFLRSQIIDQIVNDGLTYDKFNSNLENYFKRFLRASGSDISNLIIKVRITENHAKLIKFEVTLDWSKHNFAIPNTLNTKMFCLEGDKLIIEYSGNNAIEFNSY